MIKKYTLWVIDDDITRRKYLIDTLEDEGLKNRINIKYFNVLSEAYNVIGTPEFILIDTTSIMGTGTLYGCFDTAISLCKGLAEKHKSSCICIQSAVKRWAEDVMEDIKDYFGDEVIVEAIDGGAYDTIAWLKKYIE